MHLQPYTRTYDPELACKALEPYKDGTIGLVGTYQMSSAMVDYVKEQYPNASYLEASDLIDRIKVIKSEEEIEFIKGTAAQQDVAMQAVIDQIKPGMKDSDVAAVALFEGQFSVVANRVSIFVNPIHMERLPLLDPAIIKIG